MLGLHVMAGEGLVDSEPLQHPVVVLPQLRFGLILRRAGIDGRNPVLCLGAGIERGSGVKSGHGVDAAHEGRRRNHLQIVA